MGHVLNVHYRLVIYVNLKDFVLSFLLSFLLSVTFPWWTNTTESVHYGFVMFYRRDPSFHLAYLHLSHNHGRPIFQVIDAIICLIQNSNKNVHSTKNGWLWQILIIWAKIVIFYHLPSLMQCKFLNPFIGLVFTCWFSKYVSLSFLSMIFKSKNYPIFLIDRPKSN
jgi:hypothetical protein